VLALEFLVTPNLDQQVLELGPEIGGINPAKSSVLAAASVVRM
jgi:hypothetical protein